mgnify:CR=1 FL=1
MNFNDITNMNKIETLVKEITVLDKVYTPQIYLTGWARWCVAYVNITNPLDTLCSVVVEPENEPVEIEDTLDCVFNAGIGNARNIDDAIDMIMNYIKHEG